MKVMLLVMAEQRVILDHLYAAVQQHCDDCDIFRLSKWQQTHLGKFLTSVDYRKYDRVVIFSRLKRLMPQLAVLRCIPGLIFLEHDAYQNYMPTSKYYRLYSKLYKKLPGCRVLVSGAVVARRLQAEGVDAVFVSKGYDEQMLYNQERPRDIEVGFLGSLKSNEYAQRKSMLEAIALRTNMLIKRTQSGQEYLDTLNRIKVFVSADIGMGEFMIKNFEAMACGCVLLAWSQGEEDELLGFHDMENVVLYRSEDEAVEKLDWLRRNPELAASIARNGQCFAESCYSFARVGQYLAMHIQRDMQPWLPVPSWTRLWAGVRYGLCAV